MADNGLIAMPIEIGIAGTTTRPGSDVVRTPDCSERREMWVYSGLDPAEKGWVITWHKRPNYNNYYPFLQTNQSWTPDGYESLAEMGKAVAKGGSGNGVGSNQQNSNHSQRFVDACELIAKRCEMLTKASYTIRKDEPDYDQFQRLGIPLGFIHPSNIFINLQQERVVLTDIGWYPDLNKSTLCANGTIWQGIYQQNEIESICNQVSNHNYAAADRIAGEKVRLAKVIELALTDGARSLNQSPASLFINPNWQQDLKNIGSISRDFKEFADKIREIGQPPKPVIQTTPENPTSLKKIVKICCLALVICGVALATAYYSYPPVPPVPPVEPVPPAPPVPPREPTHPAIDIIKAKSPTLADKYKSIASRISSQETIEEIRFQESFRSELRSFLTELESITVKEKDPASKGVLDNFNFYLKSYLEE